jgi:hypothetical protein
MNEMKVCFLKVQDFLGEIYEVQNDLFKLKVRIGGSGSNNILDQKLIFMEMYGNSLSQQLSDKIEGGSGEEMDS